MSGEDEVKTAWLWITRAAEYHERQLVRRLEKQMAADRDDKRRRRCKKIGMR